MDVLDKKYVRPDFGAFDLHRISSLNTFKRYIFIQFTFTKDSRASMYPNLLVVKRNSETEVSLLTYMKWLNGMNLKL